VEIGRRFNLPRSPAMGLAQTRRTIGGP
jgi:hypothetical protein